jgi:hypothetical protein
VTSSAWLFPNVGRIRAAATVCGGCGRSPRPSDPKRPAAEEGGQPAWGGIE